MALSEEPGAQPIITAADNNTQLRVKHSLLFRLFSAHKLLWSQKTTPCPPTAAPWHFRRTERIPKPSAHLRIRLSFPPRRVFPYRELLCPQPGQSLAFHLVYLRLASPPSGTLSSQPPEWVFARLSPAGCPPSVRSVLTILAHHMKRFMTRPRLVLSASPAETHPECRPRPSS